MKTQNQLTAFLVLIFLVFSTVGRASEPPDQTDVDTTAIDLPAIAVIGMSNEVKHEEWRDERVGLGLRVILSQLFFESGEFEMLEEKPEIREKLNELATNIWITNKKNYDFEEDIKTIGEFEADFVAYGKVFYFGKPRTKMSLGPMHLNKRTVVIKVEVILENLKTNKKIKEKGEGKSSTTAKSALFQFREDHVELDKTNIGNATKEALAKAVEKVMKEYKKKQW